MVIYLVSFLSGLILFAAPIVAAYLSKFTNLPSILTFCFYLAYQQLLFALLASLLPSFALSFPLAACGILATAIWIRRRRASFSEEAVGDSRSRYWAHSLPGIMFFVIFISYATIRAYYSDINFNNNSDEAGVEKLFNLSMQQSFLFGTSYPPEWVWLAGERSRYYLLLKTVPGMGSWIARVLFGAPDTGGIFFILSEAFFGAMFPAVLCAWILWFGRKAKNGAAVAVAAVLLGLFGFLSTHYHAISLGLSALLKRTSVNWWSLSSEVVPYTDDQYPVWLMILGDNHAYLQIYFLQILFWGAFLGVLCLERYSFLSAAALGILAASVCLSHQCSALIDLVVLGLLSVLLSIIYIRGKQLEKLKVCLAHAATTIPVASFFLWFLYETCGKTKSVFLEKELVSPFVPFLNLNFSIFLWLGLLLLHPTIRRSVSQRLKRINLADQWILVITFILATVCYLYHRPALSVMVVMGSITFLILSRKDATPSEMILSLFAASSFSIWLIPELIVFDHTLDSRTDWIRFQMGIRFWPEGYLLIPFALTLAVIERLGSSKSSLPWMLCTAAAVLLLFLSHIPGVTNRISRSRQLETSINGFKEFSRRYTFDHEIVSFLQTLPDTRRVVIAEACGLGDSRVPIHFAWPGRIAAFSGRTGICGWIRHAMLYASDTLDQAGFRGASVGERGMTYLKCYLGFFSHVLDGETEQAKLDLMELRALGVTHIVFGQFERDLFQLFSVDKVPKDLPLKVAFKTQNGMGVLEII